MTDDVKRLDDYVAAMHVLVQDGRALQGGRQAFADAKGSLDDLVAEQRQLGATLTTQSDRLGGALAVLEAQDVDVIERAIREQAESAEQRDAETRAAFQRTTESLTSSMEMVETELKQSSQRLDDFRTMLRQHIDASERRQQELSSTMQELVRALAEGERQLAVRHTDLEGRLKVITNLSVALIVGIVVIIALQFIK